MVEIAKALSMDVRILVMDEPTAVLTKREVDKLFALIDSLKRKNISVIYISHRMEEIFALADRITVLRDGQFIKTLETKETDRSELISLMVGRELNELYSRSLVKTGNVILEGKNLTSKDGKVKKADFILKKGEIAGFAGLVGSGRTELMKMVFGIEKPQEGEILLNGEPVRIRNVRDAMKNGIGLVSEDRKLEGLFLENTVKFNISIGVLDRFCRRLRIDASVENQIADKYIRELGIKVASPTQLAINLSGGNQQKVVLSKWLAIEPDILIMDEPTRGIDIGAKAEIYAIMDKLIQKGVSIIMISSEMPELINMCDRLYVMSGGEIKACMEHEEIDQEKILRYAMGG